MNIFKEMILSIYSYGSYSQFLKNKKGKVFGFGVVLVLLYFVVAYLLAAIISMGSSHGLLQSYRENVPDFEVKNGILWVEDVVEMDTGASYIYINTDHIFYSTDEIMQYLRGHRQAILMDAEKIILKDDDGEMGVIYFSDLDMEMDKEDVESFIPWIYVIYFAIMPFVYIWITALFFFGVLFVALMGMIVASCMNYKLTFGQLYLLGIYSRTLPLLIKALISFLPFHIPFFWVINFGLSLFIMIMAIKKMKEQEAAC